MSRRRLGAKLRPAKERRIPIETGFCLVGKFEQVSNSGCGLEQVGDLARHKRAVTGDGPFRFPHIDIQPQRSADPDGGASTAPSMRGSCPAVGPHDWIRGPRSTVESDIPSNRRPSIPSNRQGHSVENGRCMGDGLGPIHGYVARRRAAPARSGGIREVVAGEKWAVISDGPFPQSAVAPASRRPLCLTP